MGDAAAANGRWADMLARWAIPDELLAAAPTSPFFFDAAVFIVAAREAVARDGDSPSDAVAREALPRGGTVLDIGVGAGAASLPLADRAGHIEGVDASRELLDAFSTLAGQSSVAYSAIQGRWPDVAATTSTADVVVCHHVIYNVPDLEAFASAMTAHAAVRVVTELTTVHPMAWMSPYWEAMHGLTQPDRPTVDDAIEVLTAMGLRVGQSRWIRSLQMIGETEDAAAARIARRLCLAPQRLDELRRVLAARPPPTAREVCTVWWAGFSSPR